VAVSHRAVGENGGNVVDRGDEGRATPSHAELERAIASVPGVVEAIVATGEGSTRSRLRIRLAPQEDAEAVAWAVAATLRERFGIALDPDDIRPRTAADAADHPDAAPPPTRPAAGVAPEAPPSGRGGWQEPSHQELLETRERLSRAAREAAEGRAGERRPGPDPLDVLWGRRGEEEAPASAAPPTSDVPTSAESLRPPSREASALSPNGVGEAESRPAPERQDAAGRDEDDPGEVDTEAAGGPAHPSGGPEAEHPSDGPEAEAATARAEDAIELEAAVGASGAASAPAVEPLAEQPSAHPGQDLEPGWGARAGELRPVRLPRAVIRNLDTQLDRHDVRVTATLEHAGRAAHGEALSIATGHGVLRAVAEATVAALRGLSSERLIAGIDRIVLDPAHDPATAMVVLTLVSARGEERLVGSSIVRGDPERAVMRATLDALNRRVASYLLDDVAAAGA
jgi:hypothetical protein